MQSKPEIKSLQYPIGRWDLPETISSDLFDKYRATLELFPKKLEAKVDAIGLEGMRLRYRAEGWTKNQVVNHLADSHINAYIRLKQILTEDKPAIRPYVQSAWAKTIDAQNEDLIASFEILRGVHNRFSLALSDVTLDDLSRTWTHPEQKKEYNLLQLLAMYDWHCRHHFAHLELAGV